MQTLHQHTFTKICSMIYKKVSQLAV